MTDLFEFLNKFDIPIEGLHTETGPGTYEAAISYSDILEAADRAVLFKTAVKEIAYRHGIMATFMAKIKRKSSGMRWTCSSESVGCGRKEKSFL